MAAIGRKLSIMNVSIRPEAVLSSANNRFSLWTNWTLKALHRRVSMDMGHSA